jgi:hypothetical protein
MITENPKMPKCGINLRIIVTLKPARFCPFGRVNLTNLRNFG